jgi:hypothetical protein
MDTKVNKIGQNWTQVEAFLAEVLQILRQKTLTSDCRDGWVITIASGERVPFGVSDLETFLEAIIGLLKLVL